MTNKPVNHIGLSEAYAQSFHRLSNIAYINDHTIEAVLGAVVDVTMELGLQCDLPAMLQRRLRNEEYPMGAGCQDESEEIIAALRRRVTELEQKLCAQAVAPCADCGTSVTPERVHICSKSNP